MRALTANRQATAMTQAAIAAQIHQPLDVHGDLTAQITLDSVVAVDQLADLRKERFRRGQESFPVKLGGSAGTTGAKTAGNEATNVDPWPGVVSTQILPPCASTAPCCRRWWHANTA